MYKVIYASDLHGNKELYTKLVRIANEKRAKAIILGGDLCPHAHLGIKESIEYQKNFLLKFLLQLFKKFNGDIYIIMGNDDFAVNMKVLEESERVNAIHLKKEKIHKYNLLGYSYVPQMPFYLKDWEKMDNKDCHQTTDPGKDILSISKPNGTIEDDFKKVKRLSEPKKTIYVIHSPPYNTKLDIVSNGTHVGSKSVRKFIEENQPLLTLHGHIHESPDISGSQIDKIGETICINVGKDYNSDLLKFAEIDLDNLNNIYFYEI